jgi:hypothetical protein
MASYCGVGLRDSSGHLCGTLRHFDEVPCDVPVNEIALMEAAGRLVGAWFEANGTAH